MVSWYVVSGVFVSAFAGVYGVSGWVHERGTADSGVLLTSVTADGNNMIS